MDNEKIKSLMRKRTNFLFYKWWIEPLKFKPLDFKTVRIYVPGNQISLNITARCFAPRLHKCVAELYPYVRKLQFVPACVETMLNNPERQ